MRETAPETAHRTAESAERASGGVNARTARGYAYGHAREETAPGAVTRRNRASGWISRLVDEWSPPQPWRHRPTSLAAMHRYAYRARWTGPTGPARRAGIWWFRLVAIPVTVVCHYTAWIVARPSRTAAIAVLWTVLMHIPAARTAAAWLLPLDPWPTWLP